MPDEFKLPGSSYQEVSKIIQGYADLGKAASLAEVSKVIGGMDPTTISRNTGFLVATGILEAAGKNKSPTPLGLLLGKALMHEQAEETRRLYADLVAENEFLKGIVSAIRIRKGMDDNALRSHIAYSAGAKKSNTTTTGSGTVIEILQLSGAIIAEDGKFVVAPLTPNIARLGSEDISPSGVSDHVRQREIPRNGPSGLSTQPLAMSLHNSRGAVSININIEVTCEAGDLDTMGSKLRRIIDELGQSSEKSGAEGESDAYADEG